MKKITTVNKSECQKCKKFFVKERNSLGKFCSKSCYWQALRIYGDKPKCADCGSTLSAHGCERCVRCHSAHNTEDRHQNWKGDQVGYHTLHKWVEKQLGRPNKCTECGKIGYGHQIHWANVSGDYKRDVSDWVRLCVKCHKAFDAEKSY